MTKATLATNSSYQSASKKPSKNLP